MPKSKRATGRSASQRTVVMCDFDGTITLEDTSEYILKKYAKGDWKKLDAMLDAGDISIEECMNEQFAMVNRSEEAIVKELDKAIAIRPGFPKFVESCIAQGMEFYVVSAGLSFAIRHFIGKMCLGDKVKVHSPIAQYDGWKIVFSFPPLTMPDSLSFKDDLVRRFRSGGMKVIYIGDGSPDSEAAILSDLRFAVKGRKLEAILKDEGLDFQSFEDFEEVTKLLGG